MILISDAQFTVAIITALGTMFTALAAVITAFKGLLQSRQNGSAIQTMHDCLHEQHAAVIEAVSKGETK